MGVERRGASVFFFPSFSPASSPGRGARADGVDTRCDPTTAPPDVSPLPGLKRRTKNGRRGASLPSHGWRHGLRSAAPPWLGRALIGPSRPLLPRRVMRGEPDRLVRRCLRIPRHLNFRGQGRKARLEAGRGLGRHGPEPTCIDAQRSRGREAGGSSIARAPLGRILPAARAAPQDGRSNRGACVCTIAA